MKKTFILVGIGIVIIYFIYSYKTWFNQDYFRVVFFDVGQGDSSLIVTPNGQTILIDGGPDNEVLRVLGKFLPFWQRQLDLLILTHEHEDHLFGLAELSRRYKIKVFLKNKIDYQIPAVAYLQESLTINRTKIINAEPGMVFKFDSGCSLSILAADKEANLLANDYSIVTLFNCLDKRILLTGDAGVAVEQKIIANGNDISADILKVAHHGSLSANSLAFLKLVKPKAAIISVGADNKYNLPAPIILDRLKNLPVYIYRTDKLGNIEFLANNKLIKLVKTSKNN